MARNSHGLSTKNRSSDYAAGHRRASRGCVAWLYRRAAEMNDPKAKDVLNSAAFALGQDLASGRKTEPLKEPE